MTATAQSDLLDVDSPSQTGTAPSGATVRKAVVAGAFGTVMEWYDLVTYGYLAHIIGKQFFPSDDPTASLLAALGSFGVGFLARPLGGILFGTYSDRHGRKAALMFSMLLMAGATAFIGMLPTYQSIGFVAPLLLVLARILQGLSAGGEGPTALSFIVEWAPRGRRGVTGSLQSIASGSGLLLGSATVALLTTCLTTEDLESWGWRIPFLVGFIVGPFGMWIRRNIGETPAFVKAVKAKLPSEIVSETLPWRGALQAFVFVIFWSVGYYIFLTYMPTFLTQFMHVDAKEAFRSNTWALIVYVMVIPIFGHLSDKYGRKPLLFLSCLGFVVLPYPMFNYLLSESGAHNFVFVQILFVILLAMYSGPSSATLAELFPTRGRSKWLGIGYGISVAIFGGFTPFAVTWLIKTFHAPIAVALYVAGFALIGGIFILTLKETAYKDLQ